MILQGGIALACGRRGWFDKDMKKHSRQEIMLKLVQADELARAGNSQVDICKALGVSVMTLHRWRKLPLRREDNQPLASEPAEPVTSTSSPTMADMRRVLEELTLENRRLRKIVTDLLLEKMRIEEASSAALRSEIPQVGDKRKT